MYSFWGDTRYVKNIAKLLIDAFVVFLSLVDAIALGFRRTWTVVNTDTKRHRVIQLHNTFSIACFFFIPVVTKDAQTLYSIVIPHSLVITTMAQRWPNLVRHLILYTYFTIVVHIFCYFYVYSLCNPNRFLYSILHMTCASPKSLLTIPWRTKPYKLLSTARSYLLGRPNIFLHHRIYFTVTILHMHLQFYVHKSTPVAYLYFLGSLLYKYKSFFLSFIST